ncbi:PAS domain-containing protein [Spirosoma soli]
MGQLTRQHDWSKTSLGTPDTWPQSLRTTLSILLNSRFPMFLFWSDELICFYNDAYRSSLGNNGKHPTALGQPGALVWPEIWDTVKPLIDQVLAGEGATWSEDQLIPIYRNGHLEDVYWTFSYSPVSDELGQPAGVFVTCTETTQQVNTVKQLRLSEQRFQNLVRDASVGIIVLNGEETRVTIVNDAYGRLINRSVSELLGKPLFSVIPEAEDVFRPIIDGVRLSGEPLYLNDQPYFVYANGDKKEGFLNLAYHPYRELDGSITGVIVLCQDVTEQVLARQRMEETQRQLQNLLMQAPVAVAIFRGPEHIIELANQAHLAIWGRQAEEVMGKPLFEALPEVKGQGYEALLAGVLTTGEPFYANELSALLIRNGQPERVYFNFVYQALRELDGTITGVIVVANDITEMVLGRHQLESGETRLRSLVDSAPFPIGVYVGKEMRIQLANQSILDVWGKGTNVIGQLYADVLPELAGQGIYEQLAEVYTTGVPFHANNQQVNLVIDGQLKPYYFKYSFTPLYDAYGEVYGVMNTAADVTDLVLAQQKLQLSEDRYRLLSGDLEQLVQQRTEELEAANEELAATNEELTATNEELLATNEQYVSTNEELTESTHLLSRSNHNLEQFAYVASHDLQEPLRKIQQFSDLLKGQYAEQLGEGVSYLERMQVAASRMSTLIRDLLTFSRIATQQETRESVSLNAVITTVLTDLELVIAETEAKVQVDPLPTVLGDPMQLGQLFGNLLSNALKFRRPGVPPVVKLTTRWLATDHLPPDVKPGRAAIAYHLIEVTDNGIGFDEKYLDRMFQVFQRLHGRSEYAGTGIGLAICQKVVINHGGAIAASSQPGQGATFKVYLPV